MLKMIISSLSGQIGLVERGEVQFGVTAFYASEGRAQAVDLSVTLDHAG